MEAVQWRNNPVSSTLVVTLPTTATLNELLRLIVFLGLSYTLATSLKRNIKGHANVWGGNTADFLPAFGYIV